jgi:hypothetical protein
MIRALFLVLLLLTSCGISTQAGGARCPIGATCSAVCRLTTDQEIYYLNKPDHDTGYKQDTTFEGSVYCSAGQIFFKGDRGGDYSQLAAGTYGEGQVGTLCGFTIDTSCAISGRTFPQ